MRRPEAPSSPSESCVADLHRPAISGPGEPFGPVAYKGDILTFEGTSCEDLARDHGTPLYVYAPRMVREEVAAFREAFAAVMTPEAGDPVVAYAVKANPSLALLREVARAGGGADIVSGGELGRARSAGIPPERIVFAGVGKTDDEIRRAIRERILSINVESLGELDRVEKIARAESTRAPVSIRANPDVDPKTHAYISTGQGISKFGIDPERTMTAYRRIAASEHLAAVGLHIHIGSQITQIAPFEEAAARADALLEEIAQKTKIGTRLSHLDIGGGLGIRYLDQTPPSPRDLARAFGPVLAKHRLGVILEPGRRIVGNAGILLARVVEVKETDGPTFVVVDAAMNDLLRPALYQAYHGALAVRLRAGEKKPVDLVGPVCETGDFLALARRMPPLERGDLVALLSAGAYGASMGSTYNLRPRPAEVLVEKGTVRLARRRETEEDLSRFEA